MEIQSFKDLVVWQKSMRLVIDIYALTAKLPKQETYGLIGQLQRASVSIPSNIAEGSKRSSRADYKQFCNMALGSAAEVETQLLLVQEIYQPIDVNPLLDQVSEVQKMLTVLIKRLKTPR